jgi:hypothetical protein
MLHHLIAALCGFYFFDAGLLHCQLISREKEMAGILNKARRSVLFGASVIAGFFARPSSGATMSGPAPTGTQNLAALLQAQLAAGGGASLLGFVQGGAGATVRTAQDKLRELPVSLYDFGGTSQGDCIAAMDKALASGARVIQVPDGVTLGRHIITSPDITILGGKNVHFAPAVTAAGFQVGTSGRVKISGFVNAILATYPDKGGIIDHGHVFVSLASGAVIDELIITDNSVSGGRIGISAGFENGRTLNRRCEIRGNVCSNQNGGLGGEGYAFHYANENDSGKAYIADNIAIEAGRHSFYIARNKGAPVSLIGNKALRHRQNSTSKGRNVRAAFAIFRSSNVTGYGNHVDGFYDGAIMFSEETETVASPLNTDDVRLYGTILRNPNNVTAAIWTGYTTPSATATVNGILLDGVTFDSRLSGSQVFQYSWGRSVKIRGLEIIYRDVTGGARMLLLQGNALSNSSGLAIEDVNVHLHGCKGTFSIMRPIPPFATSAMPLRIRDIKLISNSGGATVNDWEPSVTVTNTEIDVFGFSFPDTASASPKQTQFPSAIQTFMGSATWDPASVPVNGRVVFDVTVPGAAPGDFCLPAFSHSLASMSMTASVEKANTAAVCLTNNGSAPVDLPSGTVSVIAIRRK